MDYIIVVLAKSGSVLGVEGGRGGQTIERTCYHIWWVMVVPAYTGSCGFLLTLRGGRHRLKNATSNHIW